MPATNLYMEIRQQCHVKNQFPQSSSTENIVLLRYMRNSDDALYSICSGLYARYTEIYHRYLNRIDVIMHGNMSYIGLYLFHEYTFIYPMRWT